MTCKVFYIYIYIYYIFLYTYIIIMYKNNLRAAVFSLLKSSSEQLRLNEYLVKDDLDAIIAYTHLLTTRALYCFGDLLSMQVL